MASSLASSYFDTGDPYFDEKYVEEIRKITPEQIQTVARQYLLTDRMNVAVIKPPFCSPTPNAADMKAREATEGSPPNIHILDNGLKVLVKADSSLPIVNIHLFGIGGLYLEDITKPGLSSFTASLLTSGTKERSKLEIFSSIEGVGGGISAQSESNTYHITVKVLKDDLDLALDILSDILLNAEFPQDEIERRRKETLLSIQKRDENWQAEVARLFKKSYFEKSSYINDHLGTKESVSVFKKEDIQSFYRRMVNPRHSVIAVYGDVDGTGVLAGIKEKLSPWTGETFVLPEQPDETRRIGSSRLLEKKTDKSSAALIIGTNGISFDSPDRPILDVLDAVLSGTGYPGGRLFEALRGTQDLVYVVGASPFYGRRAGYFSIITQTTLGNLERVQSIILDHLKRITEEPVPAEELQRAKDMIISAHHLGRETLDAQAQQAALSEVIGLGWDYDSRYIDLIKSVRAEQIQRLAKEILSQTLIVRTLPEKPSEILATPTSKHGVSKQ